MPSNLIYPIIFIFWLIFFIWVVVTLTPSFKSSPSDPVLTCPTYSINIYNGEKRLVNGSEIDPSYEACTRGDKCDFVNLPYSLNSDGSVNESGDCSGEKVCRCVSKPQCPKGTSSLFQLFPSTSYFTQRSTDVGNSYTSPFIYDNSFETCFINSYDLIKLNSNNPACNNSTLNVGQCVQSNPCLEGTMVFDGTPGNDLSTYPLRCLAVPQCVEEKTPFWDSKSFKLSCV